MTNALKPLESPFSAEVEKILATYPKQDGYLLTLFRTFANSVRFLKKGVPNLLDKDSPLSLRTREIVILRTTANKNCEYEWGVHVAIFANAARFSDHQIRATRLGRADCWTSKETGLIDAIDQLCTTGTLEEKTRDQFESDWSKEEQLEIIALIGTYCTISFVANVAQLSNEPFAAEFP